MISARKAKHLDVTTMFTYSHANTPLGQSERAYYLSYFINPSVTRVVWTSVITIVNNSNSFNFLYVGVLFVIKTGSTVRDARRARGWYHEVQRILY